LETVASGVTRPNYLVGLAGDPILYLVQASGLIRTIDPEVGLSEEPFLDLREVVNDNGIEQGLLGLAFHPSYLANGRLFVYFTDNSDDSRLVEYSAAGGSADPASARELLRFAQPTVRHNAGMLQFGPDGYLYLAVGDGGAASVNGQDPTTLLGTILRLDVDGGEPYAIPPDNPFDGSEGAPEVWAYGLRNPWRFWIDAGSRLLYIGDVGQSDREEINVASLEAAGVNYGWPTIEGTRCFYRASCDPSGLQLPVLEYGHDEGCSVTGGVTYRGTAIPELTGHYFYADWCGRWVRSFLYADGQVTEERDWTDSLGGGRINSFGVDGLGEIYVMTQDGDVQRIVPER
jgi:glucose/arabinose dehydrogenase